MQGWAPARIEGLKPTSGTMRSAAYECSDGARTSSVGYHQPAAALEDHCTEPLSDFFREVIQVSKIKFDPLRHTALDTHAKVLQPKKAAVRSRAMSQRKRAERQREGQDGEFESEPSRQLAVLG